MLLWGRKPFLYIFRVVLTAAVCGIDMAGVDDEECTLVSHKIRSHSTHNNDINPAGHVEMFCRNTRDDEIIPVKTTFSTKHLFHAFRLENIT